MLNCGCTKVKWKIKSPWMKKKVSWVRLTCELVQSVCNKHKICGTGIRLSGNETLSFSRSLQTRLCSEHNASAAMLNAYTLGSYTPLSSHESNVGPSRDVYGNCSTPHQLFRSRGYIYIIARWSPSRRRLPCVNMRPVADMHWSWPGRERESEWCSDHGESGLVLNLCDSGTERHQLTPWLVPNLPVNCGPLNLDLRQCRISGNVIFRIILL